ITDYSRPSPSIESNSNDLQSSNSSVSENGESSSSILSKHVTTFAKAADSPTVIKTNKDETIKKSSVKYAEMYRKTSKSFNVKGNQRNWNNLKSQQLGENFLMKNKACFKCGQFDHLAYNCGVWMEQGKTWAKNNYTHKSRSPKTVFHKTDRTPAANIIDDKGYWDSGCSRHMTGNISYLFDYEPYDGGYVSFGQGGGKITCKEPKMISDALKDPSWVEAMQEELLQFKNQNVWILVDCPKGVRPIETKWVLKNKKDERGIVIRNKARLVAQGHTQEEGIDYKEVFALVARIKAIRLFFSYASFMGFTLYQMDVKSAFLYGTIDEEVYAPRAWYGTLSKYLLTNGFQRGTIDQTLFIRKHKGDFLLVQVYIDDIIFGSLNPQLCREFEALMHEKFQMSAMGELNFFLGLQVLQKKDGIFLSQDKYVGDILKKFGYSDVRSVNNGQGESLGKRQNWHQMTPKECHLHTVKRIF
nr:putative ribonuclease H-like domain-containing protein [Tanacetum cinerariifolium]